MTKKLPTRVENSTLVVSPDERDEQVLSGMLGNQSWRVSSARTFREALRVLGDKHHPTVIACEQELPDGSWRDLFEFLETRLENPPPLVVVSRQADEALWAEVLNVGGYDVLTKPFDGEEVSRVMTMAGRQNRERVARLTGAPVA
jgi:DNA-binding response OmpR family regulator